MIDLCQVCEQTTSAVNIRNVREFISGLDHEVPLLDGGHHRYVNLDNAATTPPLQPVLDCLMKFFEWYSSVHRGSGFKSLLSTHVYERCREVVADFVGADLSHHTVIFVQNATHALNKLAMRVSLEEGSIVLATTMEHHSNLLPWRKVACRVNHARVRRDDGSLDLHDLEAKIRRSAGRLGLVTVTAASNVTGVIPPLRRIARMAHEAGALVAVDATQLVPHRTFRMGAPDDPERVDFAAFSAHKMYAPFGAGVLIGPRSVFEEGTPDMVGGGTINAVTMDDVVWSAPPESDEAGTPNVPGCLALAVAIQTLTSIGMDELAEHERALTRRALEQMTRIEGLKLYGPTDPRLEDDRLGVIPFDIPGLGHAKTAAILGYEWGIGVRSGCFCAQPYVRELLGVSGSSTVELIGMLAQGRKAEVPGLVRASIGVYNSAEEVDYFVEALRSVIADGPRGNYVLDDKYRDYVPDPPVFGLEEYAPF